MRNHSSNQARQTGKTVGDAPTLETLHGPIATRRPTAPSTPSTGKHRASLLSEIPEQRPRDHPEHVEELQTIAAAPAAVEEPTSTGHIPQNANWKASHLPRVFVGALLVLSLVGTWVLGLRFEASRLPEDFVPLFIGVGVVVVFWALLVATTPQEVTLNGSMLTIHNSAGHESFDLADGRQPVDIVGDPRRRNWAVLLHRSDRTSVVLRRHDVSAVEFDPIVRHYRETVGRRFASRAAGFNR